MNLRPGWSTQVPDQPGLHNETLSLKKQLEVGLGSPSFCSQATQWIPDSRSEETQERTSLWPRGLNSEMLLCWPDRSPCPTQQQLKQVPRLAFQRETRRSQWASSLAARSKHMLPRSQESSWEAQSPGSPLPQGPAELMRASWGTVMNSVSVPQAPVNIY